MAIAMVPLEENALFHCKAQFTLFYTYRELRLWRLQWYL